jgi:hypothetical protein
MGVKEIVDNDAEGIDEECAQGGVYQAYSIDIGKSDQSHNMTFMSNETFKVIEDQIEALKCCGNCEHVSVWPNSGADCTIINDGVELTDKCDQWQAHE